MGRDGTEDLKSREYWLVTKGVFRMLVASKCLRTQNYLERHGAQVAPIETGNKFRHIRSRSDACAVRLAAGDVR